MSPRGRDGYRGRVRDPNVSRSVAGQLSAERRADDLRRLRAERFDVLVIGGGVTGAGAALDAASRGLKVALVEARDYAAGTSSRSSKLIHGGLRYLEQLEFHLVHEALTERGLLATRLAPHLVRPVPILVPLPAEGGARDLPGGSSAAPTTALGVAAYDAFAGVFGGGRGMPLHRHLSREGTRRIFPCLRAGQAGRRDPLLRRSGRRRPSRGDAGPHRGEPRRDCGDQRPRGRPDPSGPRGHRRAGTRPGGAGRLAGRRVRGTRPHRDRRHRRVERRHVADAQRRRAPPRSCGSGPPRGCTWWCPGRRSSARPA